MGMSLPLLISGVTNDPRRFGHWLGRLYAVNTLGCVAGAFATGLVLIPWLGIHATFGTITAGTMIVGLTAWGLASRPAPRWRWATGLLTVVATGAAWIGLPAGEFLKSSVQEPRRLLFYGEGNNAIVSVIEEPNHSRSILVDGQPVAGTAGTSVIDQKMLAHLPMLLHPDPRRALTVGFGSGGTSMSMTLHDVDVDCVEIEAAVPAAAEHFRSENRGVLAHPRFHLILDDARSWLRVAPVHYDVIVTDCTNIQYRSNGDLYTVEYFQLMRDRLDSEGVAAAWVPANGIGEEELKTLLRSFREVFPHTSIWYMNTLPTDFLIVVGTPGALKIDLARLDERMRQPRVREDLEAVGLADPCRLLYTFLAAEDRVANYIESGPVNTDDRPILSYSTYGATYQSTIAKNLLTLMTYREDVARYVSRPASDEIMLRNYAASNEILMGHVGYVMGAETKALGHYLKGCQLLPDDAACQELMRASYFRATQSEPARTATSNSVVRPPAGN
jgi:spermidine synthase